MTDLSPHPPGLVTEEEAKILADPDTDLDEHSELRERLRTRLTETLQDFTLLYPTLPADDLEAVFTGDDTETLSSTRAATQDGLALLILGMLYGDDMIETRLRDAVQNAGISYGEEINVTLDLRRGPLPTIEQFAAQLEDNELTDQTFALFEHFLSDPDIDPGVLDDVASKLDLDITPEEKAELHSVVGAFERPPQTVITSVSVTDSTDHNET